MIMARKRTDRSKKNSISVLNSEATEAPAAEVKEKNWWRGLSRSSKWTVLGIVAFLSVASLGAGLKYLEDNAQSQKELAAKDRSLLSSMNPFASAPLPDPTPQLSKEMIYSGSRLLAVEDKNATAAPPADLAIWRPSTGVWWVQNPATGSTWTTQTWGENGDIPVAGDFDGDGTTDFSVFRPGNTTWYVIHSSTGGTYSYAFGASGDLVAPADYDGDGKTDEAIYRPSEGKWYIHASTAGYYYQSWGANGDLPAPADYDGDGKADLGVFRPSDRKFYSINSANSSLQTIDSGISSGSYSWATASSDYDGDGKADYAVFDATAANWYIRSSISGTFSTTQWGASGDTAVQNDYDADGKCDLAVWTNSGTNEGRWHIKNSSDASTRNVNWGQAADIPVPAFYRR